VAQGSILLLLSVNKINNKMENITFTLSGDLNKFYTEKGFAQKITKLLNGGF